MTKTLLACCLALLLGGAAAATVASVASAKPPSEQAQGKPDAPRRPGFSWYLGVGCVSLLALQRIRLFSPHRRRRPASS